FVLRSVEFRAVRAIRGLTLDGGRVRRLVEAKLLAAREAKAGAAAQAFLHDWRTDDLARLELLHLRVHVVCHEIEDGADKRMGAVAHGERRVGRMPRGLRRRQAENEPAVPGVGEGEFEHLAEELAVVVRIRAVEEYVRSDDHSVASSATSARGGRRISSRFG